MDITTQILQELSGPEFFAHWAAARDCLLRTPEGRPEHDEARVRYDAAAAEYRRRTDGEGHQ